MERKPGHLTFTPTSPDWAARKAALTREQVNDIVDRVTGNGLEEFRVQQEFGLSNAELLDLLLDNNVERCPTCRWLVDSSERLDDDGEVDSYCPNCRPGD